MNGDWNLTSLCLVVGEKIENSAVFNNTAVCGTFVDGSLENWDVPAVDKIAMVSVPSRISVGPNEGL